MIEVEQRLSRIGNPQVRVRAYRDDGEALNQELAKYPGAPFTFRVHWDNADSRRRSGRIVLQDSRPRLELGRGLPSGRVPSTYLDAIITDHENTFDRLSFCISPLPPKPPEEEE